MLMQLIRFSYGEARMWTYVWGRLGMGEAIKWLPRANQRASRG